MRLLAVAALASLASLAGCGRDSNPRTDCNDVLDDPAHAVARLSAKYSNQPVKVATIIEGCVAPTGTLCDRVAALVAKIPSMMSADVPALSDPLTTCQQMPPSLQSCLLPSYVLSHAAECKQALADQSAVTSIDIKPRSGSDSGAGSGVAADPSPPCPDVRVTIDERTLGYGRGKRIDMFPRNDDVYRELESGLKGLAFECRGLVQVSAAPSVTYQDIVEVMDIAIKVGLSDIAIDTGSDVPVPPPTPPADNALAKAPVLVITATDVSVDGQVIAHTTDADVAPAVRAALATKPAELKSLLIFQAIPTTSAKLIHQAIDGGRSAGIGTMLFAVKH